MSQSFNTYCLMPPFKLQLISCLWCIRLRFSYIWSLSSARVRTRDTGNQLTGVKSTKILIGLTKKLRFFSAQLLSEVRRLRDSDIFWHRVKPSQAPGYLEVVKRPMDLGTIQRNLEDNFYDSRAKFMRDINQVGLVLKYFEPANRNWLCYCWVEGLFCAT